VKKLILDLDGTITLGDDPSYEKVLPNLDVVDMIRQYKEQGFSIVISTARNMRTYDGNVGKINIHTLPVIIKWLNKHSVPFDEVLVGKPWCGYDGFYVDDKAIRPSEFVSMDYEEILRLLKKENQHKDSGNHS
jgi:capsule biosynthesis phosphatase